MSTGKWEIASLARRLADGAMKTVARAKQKFARTDVTIQRIKAEVRTRRGMMDIAQRKRIAKRGK
jgi:hypothetical protein